jgi:hypothetical protein
VLTPETTFAEMLSKDHTFERVLSGRPLMFGTAGSRRTVRMRLLHRLLWSFLDSVYYLCNALGRFRKGPAEQKEGGTYRVLFRLAPMESEVASEHTSSPPRSWGRSRKA